MFLVLFCTRVEKAPTRVARVLTCHMLTLAYFMLIISFVSMSSNISSAIEC